MDFVQQLLICILFIFHSMLNHSIEELKIDEVKGGITDTKVIIILK